MNSTQAKFIVQYFLTVLILVLPIENILKTLLLLSTWIVTFWPLRIKELALFIIVNIIFTFSNAGAISQNVFLFKNPDIAGLPYWELFMWGFYFLHVYRMQFDDRKPDPFQWRSVTLSILFAISFSLPPSYTLVVTTLMFAIILITFHTRNDVRFALHMIILGTFLEYMGVHFQQWYYPKEYVGGVAYWYVNLFGGAGILFYRVGIPLMELIGEKFRK